MEETTNILTTLVQTAGKSLDIAGCLAIVVGVLIAGAQSLFGTPPVGLDRYRALRLRVGRAILLGLELLVAGDIIRTVAVDPTFARLGVLAGIVVIRTFLSFSMELELNGRWPWQARPTDTVQH
jgi:uncharacterized membrane protein